MLFGVGLNSASPPDIPCLPLASLLAALPRGSPGTFGILSNPPSPARPQDLGQSTVCARKTSSDPLRSRFKFGLASGHPLAHPGLAACRAPKRLPGTFKILSSSPSPASTPRPRGIDVCARKTSSDPLRSRFQFGLSSGHPLPPPALAVSCAPGRLS